MLRSAKDPEPLSTCIAPAQRELVVVDIGINLTNKAFRNNWKSVIRRAIDVGVHRILLTGTSIQSSKESLRLAREWYEKEGTANLYATIGVHPHEAKSWDDGSLQAMKEMLNDPFAVAVGECGLDYNRNFSSKPDQLRAFREQVRLAHDLNYPIFVHEREAYSDLIAVLDEAESHHRSISPPKLVIHCFTGTKEEALTYIERGYYIGFTGTICKKERGAHLRELLPSLPLEKLMVETDAPYMGFKKDEGRRRHSSEPADCIDVAKELSKAIQHPFDEVCRATNKTSMDFFRIR
mmetsp:Transcript_13456/g.31441  ORF Transcript_13456/g.31441 Transcript_13456/m.31441 type:complete len:293 (+) Transcript_13456:62-940(+)